MLISVSQWLSTNFVEGSRPHRSTVVRWIKRGEINGQQIGSQWFVNTEPAKHNQAPSFSYLK